MLKLKLKNGKICIHQTSQLTLDFSARKHKIRYCTFIYIQWKIRKHLTVKIGNILQPSKISERNLKSIKIL